MNVPFLQALGVMNSSGKVVAAKYAKFRQINRFLEILGDVLPSEKGNVVPLNIIDFGSGKSYLTFAVHYYLEQIKKVPFSITGIDLKKEVIENCTALAQKLKLQNINFVHGDIAEFSQTQNPDIVITLHACDTATDYALDYAIKRGAKIILSVPCCQHEINLQLEKTAKDAPQILQPLLKYGIIRERFSALVTDATRAAVLEQAGYSVQVLEFIDMEGTPKNLLIRAVLKGASSSNGLANHNGSANLKGIEAAASKPTSFSEQSSALLNALGVRQTLVAATASTKNIN